MWKEYSVDVNEKGKICFNNIVLNIIKSKNFYVYIKMLDQSKIQYVDKKLYISRFEAIKLFDIRIKFSASLIEMSFLDLIEKIFIAMQLIAKR